MATASGTGNVVRVWPRSSMLPYQEDLGMRGRSRCFLFVACTYFAVSKNSSPSPKVLKRLRINLDQGPKKNPKAQKNARTVPKNSLKNSGALPNKTRVLRQITPESSPESSAKSLSQKFFGVPFLSPMGLSSPHPSKNYRRLVCFGIIGILLMGGGFLLTVRASLLTVQLLCLQSLKALIRRTFPL